MCMYAPVNGAAVPDLTVLNKVIVLLLSRLIIDFR